MDAAFLGKPAKRVESHNAVAQADLHSLEELQHIKIGVYGQRLISWSDSVSLLWLAKLAKSLICISGWICVEWLGSSFFVCEKDAAFQTNGKEHLFFI